MVTTVPSSVASTSNSTRAVPVGRKRTSSTIRWSGSCSSTSVESCNSAPGSPDRVMELAAFMRPVGIDAAEATRADDPTRIGVGVVEHFEHRLG